MLGKVIAPTQGVGLTSPAVRPAREGMMRSGNAGLQLPDSTRDTTGQTSLAAGDNPCVRSMDPDTAAGVGVATKTPNTGDSVRSRVASVCAGPLVVVGPAAPLDGGSYRVSTPTPGPTQSQASGHQLQRWT